MKKIQPGVHVIVRPSRAQALNLDPDRPFRVLVVHDRDEPGTNRFQNLPPWAKTSVTIEVPVGYIGVPLRAGEPSVGCSRGTILDAEDCAIYVPPVKVKRTPRDRESALYSLRRDMNLRWGGWKPVPDWTRLAYREEARRLRVQETGQAEIVAVQESGRGQVLHGIHANSVHGEGVKLGNITQVHGAETWPGGAAYQYPTDTLVKLKHPTPITGPVGRATHINRADFGHGPCVHTTVVAKAIPHSITESDFSNFMEMQTRKIAAAFAIPAPLHPYMQPNSPYMQAKAEDSLREYFKMLYPEESQYFALLAKKMDFDLGVNRVIVIEGNGLEADHVVARVYEQARAEGHNVTETRAPTGPLLDPRDFMNSILNWRRNQNYTGVHVVKIDKADPKVSLGLKTLADLYIVCSEGIARFVKDRRGTFLDHSSVPLGLCHPNADDAPDEDACD